MTIFEKLLEYYERNLIEAERISHHWDLLKFLDSKNMDFGICACAMAVFEEDIYDYPVVKSFTPKGYIFWDRPPFYLKTREEMIKSLKYRISILRKITYEFRS